MAIQLNGNGGVIAEVDGTTWRSLRMTDRPVEMGAGGYYKTFFGALTAAGPAAAANIASFRWTNASLLCLIRNIEIYVAVTTASTAGVPELGCYIARGFTASDTGGTAVNLTGNNMKSRTSMPTSTLGDLRYASAATLTAGTRTLDAQPVLSCAATGIALGSNNKEFFNIDGPGDHPIVLATNEGLVFQNITAVTAGVYQYKIGIHWAEVPAY